MALKVHLSPGPEQTKPDNGVGQVIHAQARHLPACGIELVNDPDEADVIAAHIQQGALPRVDVLHCHGLYWSGDPNSGSYAPTHHEANQRILDAARRATLITVPSAWVAEPFKRDMRISPRIIGHGIDLDTLPAIAKRHKGYVLWNKNRPGDACNPAPAIALARRGVDVVSTFGQPVDHLRIVGPQPHADMLELVRHAEVYLATTKETFGIGTLEALGLGIPVLGYAWGGTNDLITPDCGVLVAPGDIDGLIAGLAHIRANYPAMRMAARARAKRYTWTLAAQQYAAVYQDAYDLRQARQHRVAVVITNYNYAEYVGGAIYSAAMQTLSPHEIIVVDDGSTDSSNDEIAGALAEVRGDFPEIVTRHIQQSNQGVAAARNAGISAATSEYIVCLDADDELAPGYLKAIQPALANDPGLGVAYAGLAWLHDDGPIGPNIWRGQFDWERQTTPSNPPSTTIHCAAMFRRSMWERAGGYQQIYAPAEDAEFFTRGLSVGFTARMVTDQPLFLYRNTPASASKAKPYRPIDTWHPWMRDKAYPMAAPAVKQPLVRSYSEPLISVIIPVGPGHAAKLPAAIDSLLGQTFRGWELVVVDDTGGEGLYPDVYMRYPFMKMHNWPKRLGAGAARNLGLKHAKAPLVLFLDADDYLIPTALQAMLERYRQGDAGYVYTDWYSRDAAGQMTAQPSPEFDATHWLTRGACAVTALMATADARAGGGFDEALPAWEDWDFFIKLTINGVCGVRLPEPLLVYQLDTGGRRSLALSNADMLRAQLRERYGAYMRGETAMARCCGGNGDAIQQAKQQLDGAPIVAQAITPTDEGVVRMEFIGANVGAVTFTGKGGRRQYRGGNNPLDKYHNVDPQDAAHLEATGQWRIVFQPEARPVTVPVAAVLAEPESPALPPLQGPGLLDTVNSIRAHVGASPKASLLPIEDELTPEQEAEANRAAAAMARAQRRKGAA